MKKIIAFLAIGLFLLSIPLAAQADNYQALADKLTAAQGQQSLVATADGGGYQYAAVFAYTVNDPAGYWWSGLVVYDFSGSDNEFMIGCYDTDGDVASEGTFSVPANGSLVDMIQAFMDSGTVPERGSVGIFGTGNFMANLFVGNTAGGFGEVEKEAVPY